MLAIIIIFGYILPAVIGYKTTRELYIDGHMGYTQPDGIEIFGVLCPVVNIIYMLIMRSTLNRAKGKKRLVEKFLRL